MSDVIKVTHIEKVDVFEGMGKFTMRLPGDSVDILITLEDILLEVSAHVKYGNVVELNFGLKNVHYTATMYYNYQGSEQTDNEDDRTPNA